jgi:hypothetical protein
MELLWSTGVRSGVGNQLVPERSFASINKDQIGLRKDLKRPASSSSPWNTLQTTQTKVKLAGRKDTTSLGFGEAHTGIEIDGSWHLAD